MKDAASEQTEHVFEIGLVLAGAVSAGAYSAGVMDFFIEAVDAWYTAKQDEQSRNVPLDQRRVPPHDISIRAISGASAGSMVAALAAVALNENFPHVDPVSPPGDNESGNKFYDSWVIKATIEEMLATGDLENRSGALVSLLNCSFLKDLASEKMKIGDDQQIRTYVSDCLPLYLCVTNLRGVPYSIDFRGLKVIEHGMSNHADFVRFDLIKPEARGKVIPDNSSIPLHPQPQGNEEEAAWDMLADSALASGAFPVALEPRVIKRKMNVYDTRDWSVPHDEPKPQGGKLVCSELMKIEPAWPADSSGEYTFVAVDGGAINNEPMEYARRVLAGPGGRNKRDGSVAHRAVIMIDPFPNTPTFKAEYDPDKSLSAVVRNLISSLVSQPKFKLDELKLAREDTVFSRFIIAPSRSKTSREKAKSDIPALASSTLAHFGGFLCREFRHHDFLLGRRNCQLFLEKYFVLPSDNDLFKCWPDDLKRPNSPFIRHLKINKGTKDEKEIECLPIIPLIDEVSNLQREKKPEWPLMPEDRLRRIEKDLQHRGKLVSKKLVTDFLYEQPATGNKSNKKKAGWVRMGLFLGRPLINFLASWIAGRLAASLKKKIRKELSDFELVDTSPAP